MQSSAETPDRTAGIPGRPHDRDNVFSVLGVGLTALLALLLLILVVAIFFPPQHAFRGLAAYLPLHTAMETFAIVVSMLVFAVGWNAHSEERAGNIVLLSCAFLAVGLLDFAHLLSYPGMADFVTPSGPEKAINFWLAARGLAAFALLAAAVLPCRPFAARGTRYWLLAASVGITALAYWACLYHPDTLPATFVVDKGLTPFKIGAEYALIALYGAAAAVFFARLRAQRVDYLRQLFAACCVIAMAEFFFTLYADVTDSYNLLGHVYKAIAFFLIYQALFAHSLEGPYQQLQLSQQAVRENQERFSSLASISSDWYWEQDAEYRFTFMSGGVQGIGKRRWELPMTSVGTADWEQHKLTLQRHLPFHDFVYQISGEAGRLCWLSISGVPRFDSEGNFKGYRGTCKDITERRQADLMLRQSELRYRNLVATVPGAVYRFRVDPAGRRSMPYISEGIVDLSGLSPAEIVADVEVAFQRIPREAMPAMEQSIRISLEKLSPWLHEFPICTTSGEEKWVRGHSLPRREADGSTLWHGVFVDITEHKRAEAEHAQLAAIVETSDDAIISYDPNGTVLSWNTAAQKIFGCTAAEMIGRNISVIAPPERMHESRHSAWLLQHGKPVPSFESERVAKDGREVQVQVSTSAVRDAAGKVVRIAAILRDVTERNKAEAARARLAAIVENANVAIFTRTLDGTILSWNPAAERMLGYTAAEMIGKPVALTLPPGRRPNMARNNEGLFRGEVVARESDRITKDGRVIDVLTSHSPLKDNAGNIVGASIILQDISERKRAEAARRESEERLSGIVQSSMHAVIMVNEDMNIVLFNPAAEKIFGYQHADMSGAKLDRLIPARFRDTHGKHMNAFGASPAAARKMTERGIINGLRANGEEFSAEATISHLTLNGKKLYTVILADVTERLAAEDNLRLAAEVIKNSSEAIIITEASNRIISVNPAFTSVTGFTAEEVIGKSPRILSSGVQNDEFYQEMWASINATGRWQGEVWDRRKNGELYCEWLSISTVKNARGEIAYHTAIFSDITGRKRAETERAQLAAIVEHSGDAIIGRALDGTITSWNAGAEQVYGYTRLEVIGRNAIMLVPPERRDVFEANQKLLRDGVARQPYESAHLAKDGRRIPISASLFPIYDAKDKVTGCAAIIRDISELKRAEQEILKLNAELEQRVAERTQQMEAINKELEAFSYSVSHDLRAPLRGIDGFSEMLLKKYAGQLDKTGNDYLQRIRRASVRMGELIDDLLQLSRVSRSQIRTEPVDLSRLARSILAELQEREPERNVVTEVQDGIEAGADPRLFRIALENLLGNAWKFTGKNREAKIRFDARRQDGELIISVKDNGAGFDTKYAHKLFGAFQRLHGAAEFEGTGIGLATVQRIIHLHGGRVWADAAMDKGATFYLAIPRATRNNVTT